MTAWQANIQKWRALSTNQRMEATWRRIPRQVAQSMAFEDEPVDLQWLIRQHAPLTRPAPSKPALGC
ncbi:MAG: hypothetical protein ACKOKG_09765 [Verrucomicrobiota bacterium]